MQAITPFLWFNDNAEEAANFYVSVFKNSSLGNIARYGKGGPAPEDTVMVVPFSLDGQQFLALNGGPMFKFNEAISFVINCADQDEMDYYWKALTADGGQESQGGWLKDKFGLSWQIHKSGNVTQRITPFLWFNDNAEEAAGFYVSLFNNSSLGQVSRYGKGSHGPEGTVMVAPFSLNGQQFLALNGGPMFRFTEAVSFVVNCKDQAELDHNWNALTADGGQEGQCGWLKDKFGLSWQIVPQDMGRLAGAGGAKTAAVMQKVMGMKKLDIATMEEAFAGADA